MSYYDDELELEAKAGQLIYNYVMTERLREFFIQKVRDRDNISMRIHLGTDRRGNQVVMDILVSKITPKVAKIKEAEGEPEPTQLFNESSLSSSLQEANTVKDWEER